MSFQTRCPGRVAALALVLSMPALAAAQQSPFLPDRTFKAPVNEVSGDIAFEHIRWFTHYDRPMGGGDGFEAVARYVEQKAREYGLEEVRGRRTCFDIYRAVAAEADGTGAWYYGGVSFEDVAQVLGSAVEAGLFTERSR